MFDFKLDFTQGPVTIGDATTPVLVCKVTQDGQHDVAYYAVYSAGAQANLSEFKGAVAKGLAKMKLTNLKSRSSMHSTQKKVLKVLTAFGDKK